jgi:selenocysteine lyase/cysteine desulfurase
MPGCRRHGQAGRPQYAAIPWRSGRGGEAQGMGRARTILVRPPGKVAPRRYAFQAQAPTLPGMKMSTPPPSRPADAPLDVNRLRAETPGCAFGNHLNNAGAALPPEPVHRAIREWFDAELRLGGYESAAVHRGVIQEAYRSVEALLGATEGSVAMVENATVAFSQALSSIPFRAGDVLLTTRHDYVSNQLMFLSLAERFGVEVVRAPDGPEGGVDTQAMIELLHRRRPRLVTMTHIPTSSGLVQDPVPVAREARGREIPFLLDACQSVGQMPVQVQEIGATFVAATARKFLRGPRGSGFLWVDPEALDAGLTPLYPDLHAADWIEADLYQPAPDARRFENWEFALALVAGTGAAARHATECGLEAIRDRARALATRLREGLGEVAGVKVLDRGAELGAIVTCTVAGWTPGALVASLREEGIRTSALERSSALLDFDERGIEGALRISPHAYNTEDEVDAAVEAVARRLPG